MRRLSFFFNPWISHSSVIWAPSSPEVPLPDGFEHESRYWLRKHRNDMLVDSQRLIDYFVIELGLENP